MLLLLYSVLMVHLWNFSTVATVSASSNNTDRSPSTVAAYLHDIAEFVCTVWRGMPRLFWFVNNMPVAGLPESFRAETTTDRVSNGMGANSSLRISALAETNNSVILCAVHIVETSDRIDLQYFPSPASLLVQGLPLAPINLSEELSLNPELLNIMLSWQPPLGLVLNDDLVYVVSINVSIQNLTDQYEVITSNLSYTHDFGFLEQENYLELCMYSYLSYDTVVISLTLSSKNKVGTGIGIHKEILVDSLCGNAQYTMPRTLKSENTLVHEGTATTARDIENTSKNCSVGCEITTPQLPWTSSTIIIHNIYAIAIAIGLLLLAVFGVVVVVLLFIICWRKLKKDQSKFSCGNENIIQLQSPQILEPNEAYACVVKQNKAYERTLISGQLNPVQTFPLKPNEAYESINKSTIIYEEVV